jgi:hypothetical protein
VGPSGVDPKARAAIAGRQTTGPLSITSAQAYSNSGLILPASPTNWVSRVACIMRHAEFAQLCCESTLTVVGTRESSISLAGDRGQGCRLLRHGIGDFHRSCTSQRS